MIRALYAEDDPNVAGIVRSYIEHFAPDWQLEIVPNGTECLNRMAIGGYDILLLDLVLPDTDGLQILGELARRNDTTPVVMVTGHGQTELAVRALRAGAADCVDKTSPQFLQLVDIVKRVQERHAEDKRRPASAPLPGTHPVMLIEGSNAVANDLRDFFRSHAPQFDLSVASSIADVDKFFAAGTPAHAIVIGPNPPNTKPLEVLRRVHSHANHVPALIVSSRSDGETAVAAFKLGAQDFILQKPDYHTELVFSLNSVLRRAETERQNARLTKELETLNRSLEAQVIQRTRELQALSLRLLRIQEDERRAIARELHDEVGQLLTGLKLQLESAQKAAGDTPLRTQIAEAMATASNLLEHVRILTQQYRPRVLDDLGLQPALEWHARQFTKQTGIAVALDVSLPAGGRLPGELETVAYRIIQEALTNAARHSQAKLVSITAATTDDKKLIVEISDRGRGFDVTKALARTDSLGLAGLRERVNLAGGRIEIYSRPGEGTRISTEFPLPSADHPPAPSA
jgi:signal transduction histidine kinase/CheY-like chemotaxis protein